MVKEVQAGKLQISMIHLHSFNQSGCYFLFRLYTVTRLKKFYRFWCRWSGDLTTRQARRRQLLINYIAA